MVIQSTLIRAMDSGFSGKGKVATGELRHFLSLMCFFVCEVVKRKQHKSLLLGQRSFNINQQVAFVAAEEIVLVGNIPHMDGLHHKKELVDQSFPETIC